MIPKKIHYCWLSGEEIPEMLQKSMATWKEILPDYEWILWDTDKFNINSIDFVKEAVSVKKWAFASDYIRLFAVYTEGGIYFDTDVIVKKNIDEFLRHDFFSAVERNDKCDFQIQAAIFGAVAGHPYLKDCMDWYENRHFILPDGRFFDLSTAPVIYAEIARKYGFAPKDKLQNLNSGMTIYPSEYFTYNKTKYTKNTYAIHWCKGGWREKKLMEKLRGFLSTNLFFLKYFIKRKK